MRGGCKSGHFLNARVHYVLIALLIGGAYAPNAAPLPTGLGGMPPLLKFSSAPI